MNLWKYVAILFTCGLAVAAVNYGAIRGLPITVGVLATILGSAIVLTAIPSLVAVPWRLLQQRRNKPTPAPFIAGGMIFIVLALMTFEVASFETAEVASSW